MWSTIQNRRRKEICPDSSLRKLNKAIQTFNISVDFKDTKKLDNILEIVDAPYVISQLSEIIDDIQVVSLFPCLLILYDVSLTLLQDKQ